MTTAVKFTDDTALTKFVKMLANASINVIIEQVPTAMYHSGTKTIILPRFAPSFPVSTKLHLAAHEVSHFLHSPDLADEMFEKCNFNIIQVLEDVRIEKLILKKYHSLIAHFKKSCKYFNEIDLFSGKNKNSLTEVNSTEITLDDFSEANVLDRFNAHLKLNTIGCVNREIPFSENEYTVLKEAESIETIDDLLIVHDKLLELMEKEQKESPEKYSGGEFSNQTPRLSISEMNENNLDMENSSLEQFVRFLKENFDSLSDILETIEGNIQKGKQIKDTNTDSEENKKNKFDLVEAASDNLSNPYGNYNVYFDKINIDDYVTPIEDVYENVSRYRGNEVSTYLRNNSKNIGDMISIFKRRKNAKNKSLVNYKNSGLIDTKRLHSYKNTDKLFIAKKILPKQKNHGFILFLDFSGSMNCTLPKIAYQVLRLAEFCRRMKIPFSVYTFTTEGYYGGKRRLINGLSPCSDLSMLEVLNSSNLDRENYGKFLKIMNLDSDYDTGGTPIYSALLTAPKIISSFIAKHNVDKVNFFLFTDGVDYSGTENGDDTIKSMANSTLSFRNYTAEIGSVKCYFDELDIYYQLFKKMFNIEVTTFYMGSGWQNKISKEAKSSLSLNKGLGVINSHWGDTFLAMGDDFFSKKENDSFFVKTLMQNIS